MQNSQIEIVSGKTVAVINRSTGSILKIYNKITGLEHIAPNACGNVARLFKIMVPSSEWQSRYCDNHTSPVPKITQDESGAIVIYESLKSSEQILPITARVIITSAPNDEIRFTLELQNNSNDSITDILFPWLGGWSGVSGKGNDAMIVGGKTEFDPYDFPHNPGITYSLFHQKKYITYPVNMYCPWTDISGKTGGLSYINYVESPRNLGFAMENLAGWQKGLNLSFGWNHYKMIRPGESWRSPQIGISVHDSTWHATADKYTAWVDTWYQPAPTSRKVKTSLGFENVAFKSIDGTKYHDFSELTDIAAEGRNYGIDHLCIWDSRSLGEYGEIADKPMFSYSEQEKMLLSSQIKQAVREGSNVSALINLRLVDSYSKLFRESACNEIAKKLNGAPYNATYSVSECHPRVHAFHCGPDAYWLDARVESYRERVKKEVEKCMSFGYQSLFFDQPFAPEPSYLDKDKYGDPDQAHEGIVSLCKELRQMIAKISPDSYMIGEHCDVFASQYIDVWMLWFQYFEEAVRVAYSVPQTINCWVIDNDPSKASRAFACGLQLCITTFGNRATLKDVPLLAEHLSKLTKLKKACQDYMCMGRFKDKCGLDLTQVINGYAYGFNSSKGPAVAIGSLVNRNQIELGIDLKMYDPSGSKESLIMRLDGSVQKLAKKDRISLMLDKDEVAVWIP